MVINPKLTAILKEEAQTIPETEADRARVHAEYTALFNSGMLRKPGKAHKELLLRS